MRSLTLSTLILTLGLVACGGGKETSDGGDAKASARDAFDAGNYADAEKHYAKALDGVAKDDAGYLALKVEHLQALAYVDGDKTLEQVKAAEGFTAANYRKIASELAQAAKHHKDDVATAEKAELAAIYVMDLGRKAFPEDAVLEKWSKDFVTAMRETGGASSANALDGLGYF